MARLRRPPRSTTRLAAPARVATGRLLAFAVTTLALAAGCRYVEAGDSLPAGAPSGASLGADDWSAGRLPADVSSGEPRRGGVVTVQISTEPPSLNPIVDSDFWGSTLAEQIYEPLVGSDPYDDPDYRYVPRLAESWEVSDDQLTYTFHLRRGVRWHDGAPFTARDVIATFDKIQDPEVLASHVRAYTQELSSYVALDDFTVRFTFKRPYFLALGSPLGIGIQPAHVIGKLSGREYNEAATNPLNRAPLGTGRLRFERWASNERIELTSYADHWERPAYVDRVVFRIVKEPPVAIQLAERREVDVVTSVPAQNWRRMSSPALRAHYHRSLYYDSNYAWIGWNMERPVFRDRRVRRALTHLTNRPAIMSGLLEGLAMPTECSFYFKSDACPPLDPLPFDPKAAKALLDDAGWIDGDGDGVREKDGVPLAFSLMVPTGSPTAARMGALMKDDFARAGVDLSIQRIEWTVFVGRLTKHEFDACTLSWASGPRGDPTQVWHSSSIDGGSNFVSFRNAEADRLIAEARAVLDDDARNQLYRRFSQILYDEQPYTFLYVRPRLALISTRLRGVRESLMYYQFADWWVAAQ